MLLDRINAKRGDRERQYSIRINDQWRVCFRWDAGDAYEVKVTDYH
ncbi:MAG: type II toxin-antitoxin system RelE/ParE family toxin [Pirellulaceae bacterium]|nr:type II toxin-antitoxin system RelE/ParE family toxin [Pirellulaceae bacterium]